MLVVASSNLFSESDPVLSEKFSEAGFGFRTESGILLHPLEAGYLVKTGKTRFARLTLQRFVSSQKKKSKSFLFAFEAYCRIRSTGRLVRPFAKSALAFRAYAPGVGREENRPSQLVCLLPGAPPSAKSLASQLRLAHLSRLELIIACGTMSEMKFYKVSTFNF